MNEEDRVLGLIDLVEELKGANLEAPVLVEGRKDVASLRALGLEGEILVINTGKTLFVRSEEIAREFKKVIILTDWDRRGGQLARKMKEDLEANECCVDLQFRRDIARLSKKEIACVEEMASYIGRLVETVQKDPLRYEKRRSLSVRAPR